MKNLSDIIAPLSLYDFCDKIFNKKSFLLKNNSSEISEFFNLEKFYEAIYNGEKLQPAGYRLSKFVPPNNTLVTTMTSEVISFHDVSKSIDSGLTICVTHLELCDNALFEFSASIKKELHYLGEVQINCYLSPDESGASLHFDARLGIILQVEGKKKWKYAQAAAVEWPRANAQVNSNGESVWVSPLVGSENWEKLKFVKESKLLDVTLEPGDLLCLPAGTWHSAQATEYSLALNISVKPYDYVSIFMNLIDQKFFSDPEWRGGLLPFSANKLHPDNQAKTITGWKQKIDELTYFLQSLKENMPSINDLNK